MGNWVLSGVPNPSHRRWQSSKHYSGDPGEGKLLGTVRQLCPCTTWAISALPAVMVLREWPLLWVPSRAQALALSLTSRCLAPRGVPVYTVSWLRWCSDGRLGDSGWGWGRTIIVSL